MTVKRLDLKTGEVQLRHPDWMAEHLQASASVLLHGYPPSQGMKSLRAAWVEYQKGIHASSNHSVEQTLVTSGAREGVWLSMQAFASGRVAYVPAIGWPAYAKLARSCGARLVRYRDGDQLVELLRRDRGAKGLVVVNSPHNPTGVVMPQDLVWRIVDATTSRGHVLLWDGVYDFLSNEGDCGLRHLAAANVVRLSSASKSLVLRVVSDFTVGS